MKEKKVVDRLDLPTRLPLSLTISLYLLADKLTLNGFGLGILVTFLAIIWLVAIIKLWSDKPTKLKELNDSSNP